MVKLIIMIPLDCELALLPFLLGFGLKDPAMGQVDFNDQVA